MKHPRYCCEDCGEPVGYIGRFLEWFFGLMHNCRARNWTTPPEPK